MFAKSAQRPDATLAEVLVERARAASDLRLTLDVSLGALVAVALAWWRPAGWVILISFALGFAAFGAWGIADRELNERGGTRGLLTTLLRGVEVVAIVIAISAAIMVTVRAFVVVLGRWIS